MPKRLTRVTKDKKIGGVCAGLAAYFDADPTLIRLLFILCTLAWGGGVLAYLIFWAAMPSDQP